MLCKICGGKVRRIYKDLYDNRHGYPGRFSIEECQNCGFKHTMPQIPARKLTFLYTNFYPKRDANIDKTIRLSKKIPTKWQIFLNGLGTTCHYQTKRDDTVLDIGCGNCLSLLEITNLGGKPWGIDPDKNSEKAAKKLHLKFHLGTIHTCRFPKKHFDLITASQVLEHENNPVKFLTDCKKFLKPGGKIILSFPNTDTFFRKIWGQHWLHWHVPYHLNHFSRKSINILARRSNLKIVNIKTITPNVWTILQISSFINQTKEGVRNPMWDEPKNNKTLKDKSKINFIHSSFRIIETLFIVNRIFDFLGWGESYVVEVQKKEYGPCYYPS